MSDLRKLAEAATPGPWRVGDSGYIESTLPQSDPTDISWPLIHWDIEGLGASWRTDDDAAYIAAADPQTILALLDERDAAQKANRELADALDRMEADRDGRRVALNAIDDAWAQRHSKPEWMDDLARAIHRATGKRDHP